MRKINLSEQRGFGISLEEYERANLIRLGLIRDLPPRVYVEEFQSGGYESEGKWHQLEASYVHDDIGID